MHFWILIITCFPTFTTQMYFFVLYLFKDTCPGFKVVQRKEDTLVFLCASLPPFSLSCQCVIVLGATFHAYLTANGHSASAALPQRALPWPRRNVPCALKGMLWTQRSFENRTLLAPKVVFQQQTYFWRVNLFIFCVFDIIFFKFIIKNFCWYLSLKSLKHKSYTIFECSLEGTFMGQKLLAITTKKIITCDKNK